MPVSGPTQPAVASPGAVLDPITAYNFAAAFYESWHWSGFWRTYEAPLVQQWLKSLPAGVGLDAGSGTGVYLPSILSSGHTCIALDASSAMLQLGQRKISLPKVDK